jgi:hypothetical protein
LRLFIDGEQVAESTAFDGEAFDLKPERPLKIGFGQHDYFNGRMKDVRIYNRALSAEHIRDLSATK